eukprot:COSAG01_NODE_19656_length_997_cov_11.636971_2_plen_77_part_01
MRGPLVAYNSCRYGTNLLTRRNFCRYGTGKVKEVAAVRSALSANLYLFIQGYGTAQDLEHLHIIGCILSAVDLSTAK